MKKNIALIFFYLCLVISTTAQTNDTRSYENNIPDDGIDHSQELRIDPAVRTIDPEVYPPIVVPINPDDDPGGDPDNDLDRYVYWVHGLGGNPGSWAKAGEASQFSEHNKEHFSARKLQSYFPTYTEDGGLLIAGQELEQDIESTALQEDQNPLRDFIIARSQGGLVSKSLIYTQNCSNQQVPIPDQRFGGLVTVCSPLNGAAINNQKKAGVLSQMVEDACDALLEKVDAALHVWYLPEELGGFVDSFCNIFGFDIVPAILGSVSPPITTEYEVGNPLLDTINSCTAPHIYKVSFYGEENRDKLFWKTLNFFVSFPNDYDHWEADDEAELKLYNWGQRQKLNYLVKVAKHQHQMDLLESLGYPCDWWQWLADPAGCTIWDLVYNNQRKKRDAHQKGVDWFDDVNDQWLVAIGALDYDTTNTTVANYTCICEDDAGHVWEIPVDNPSDCSIYEVGGTECTTTTNTSTTTTIQLTYKPSDGVVLKESAVHMTGATHPPVKLINTSHMQSMNNGELKIKLTNLYDGHYGNFFKTRSR